MTRSKNSRKGLAKVRKHPRDRFNAHYYCFRDKFKKNKNKETTLKFEEVDRNEKPV